MNDEFVVVSAKEEDWEPAMELAWRTFQKFEAPVYSEEGTNHFLDFISDEKLFKMFLAGEYPLYVARCGDKIVGMVSLRSKNHVSLLFVDEKYHRKGIGRALLSFAQQKLLEQGLVVLTVNASPYGVPFYKKVGFMETDKEQFTDGIIYYPMTCLVRIESN